MPGTKYPNVERSMDIKMERIYIALVDTPGLFAGLIRLVTKINYVHVVIAMDEELKEAYSVGRRNPFIPLFAGFEREKAEQIIKKFPTARYRISSLSCSLEQKQQIHRQLLQCYHDRFRYHYCIIGLPFLLLGRPFYQKGHYTCSSFTARLLEEHGISLFSKHFSLVTPRDFYELDDMDVCFEGLLSERYEIDADGQVRTGIAKGGHYGTVRGAAYEG